MENLTSYVVMRDDFEIILNKTDTELFIEAEDRRIGNAIAFAAKFANDTIKTMSLDIFENVPEFFEGLITAFEGISDDTSVMLDKKGKLLFSQKMKIGKHEKTFNFPIPLNVVQMDAVTRLEKQMRKLVRDVERLNKENQELKEKLHLDCEVIFPTFNASSSNHYEISEDKKMIERKSNYVSGTLQQLLLSDTSLSQERNSKFHVKIEKFLDFAIGVATKDVIEYKFEERSSSLPVYFLQDMEISDIAYRGGGLPNCSSLKPKAGSIIGVRFIPSKGQILFDLDGIHVHTVGISESHQKLDFYPFVIPLSEGTAVSFV